MENESSPWSADAEESAQEGEPDEAVFVPTGEALGLGPVKAAGSVRVLLAGLEYSIQVETFAPTARADTACSTAPGAAETNIPIVLTITNDYPERALPAFALTGFKPGTDPRSTFWFDLASVARMGDEIEVGDCKPYNFNFPAISSGDNLTYVGSANGVPEGTAEERGASVTLVNYDEVVATMRLEAA